MAALLHIEVRTEVGGERSTWEGPIALALGVGDLLRHPDDQLASVDEDGRDVLAATFTLVRDVERYTLHLGFERRDPHIAALNLPKELPDTGAFGEWERVASPGAEQPMAALEMRYDIERVSES